MGDVKRFVIERERWLRGDEENSRLLRPSDGKMCCLGFFARACGIDEDQIEDEAEPEDVPGAGWPLWVLRESDDFAGDYDLPGKLKNSLDIVELIKANDDEATGDRKRESRIAEIFAKHGVEVEFR